MERNKADVIFHPVRIRAVQALFGGRKLTAHQLLAEIGSSSIATLYRHLNRLVEADILAVAEERRVHGAVERVYALAHDRAADLGGEDLSQISREEKLRHFSTLISSLLVDYERYLGQERFDQRGDGVVVRQEALSLTDTEARQVSGIIREALAPFRQNPDDGVRRRRLLTTVLLPVVNRPDNPHETD